MKIFKITLIVISLAMLFFSCAGGHSNSNMLMSTHKYINIELGEDVTTEGKEEITELHGVEGGGQLSTRRVNEVREQKFSCKN